jgi:ribosomal protein S21
MLVVKVNNNDIDFALRLLKKKVQKAADTSCVTWMYPL